MSAPTATAARSLSWDELCYTWSELLSGARENLNAPSSVSKARQVFDTLDRVETEISDAGRALLFALNSAAVQRAWDETHAWQRETFQLHAACVERFHSRIKAALKRIDSTWDPERTPKRGVDTRSVFQHFHWTHISSDAASKKLCEALHRARYSAYILQGRALLDPDSTDYSVLIDRLARQAYNFSLLAYFTQQSFRAYIENQPPTDPRLKQLPRLLEREIMNLWYAAQAADEGGYHATSAALGAKLLDQIDRWYSDESKLPAEVQRAVNGTCDSVSALGYEIPANFRNGGKFGTEPRPRVLGGNHTRGSEALGSSDSPPKEEPSESSEKTDTGPRNQSREYRIYRDVSRQVLSDLVSGAGGSFRMDARPLPVIRFVVGRADSLPTDDDRQKLFDACIRLDQLRLGFRVLERCPTWIPSASSLQQLARHLMVAQRLMPGAIRDEKQSKWLKRLAAAWASVTTSDWQDAVIHQALLGRMTSLAMGSGNTSPNVLLAGKRKDRNVLGGERYFRPLVDVENPNDIQKTVRLKFAGTHTVVVSAAPRGESLDLYAEGSESGRVRRAIPTERLDQCRNSLESARKLMKRHCLLDPTLRNNPDFKPVVDLASELVSFARLLDPRCSLLMLAIDPQLASLP